MWPILTRDIILLALLGWCNFLPILGRLALKDRFAAPIDLGFIWPDRKPVFGPHKTWRGLVFAVAGTSAAASLTYAGPILGAKLACWSMAGDLISSFIKRRLGQKSGQKAIGLDQGLESSLPLYLLREELYISMEEVLGIVIVFTLLELILSPILYRIRIRRNPH